MKNKRDLSIELLRIVLMLMIIMHHLIVHGCNLANLSNNTYTSFSSGRDSMLLLINTICIVGVNCFIFISGYYGIKPKSRTLISFLTQSTVLSISLYLFFNIIYYPNNFSVLEFLKSFIPFIIPVWWFLIAYISIYILSPIINKGLESCSKKNIIWICIAFLILFFSSGFRKDNLYTIGNGHDIFTLLIVYIIARSCSVFSFNIKKAKILYLISLFFNFIIVLLLFSLDKKVMVWQFFSYGNPFIIINSILFFYIFKNIETNDITHQLSRFIFKLAPLTFGVYLIHDYPETRLTLKNILDDINATTSNNIIMLLALVGMCIIIFFSFSLIEKIRMILCKPIDNRINMLYTNIFLNKKNN